MVPVPVPTYEKLRFRFQLHIFTIKSKFLLKNLFPFYIVSRFTRKKIIKINKMWKNKILNEDNQIHNFISSSGSGTVINYGSGSDFLTSYGSGSTRQSYGSYGSGSTTMHLHLLKNLLGAAQHGNQCSGSLTFLHLCIQIRGSASLLIWILAYSFFQWLLSSVVDPDPFVGPPGSRSVIIFTDPCLNPDQGNFSRKNLDHALVTSLCLFIFEEWWKCTS